VTTLALTRSIRSRDAARTKLPTRDFGEPGGTLPYPKQALTDTQHSAAFS
jgi:hypothetical protein